ncbi:DUF4440 domain-containing protein [Pseudoroseicyclus sp. CXY001]|uniref:DUF4440 domain-containing protein n=1 Tax=Pseudoroseicyclus sp. CXY001 TaxID=3242492 RepID=UPI003570AB43
MHDELWDLERRLWLEGREAYVELLAEDALMTFPMPGGPLDRATVLDSVEGTTRWEAVAMDDQLMRSPAKSVTLLAYSAEARREGEGYAAGCSSLWQMTESGWRLIHHQQTPL